MAAWTFFDSFITRQLNGNAIDLDTDEIRLAIITAAVTPVQGTHDFWNDLNTNEVANGNGYTSPGNIVAIDAIAASGGSVTVSASSASTSWTQNASGFNNGKHFVLYQNTGTPSSSALIAFATYSGTLDLTAGDITVTFGTTGQLFDLTY